MRPSRDMAPTNHDSTSSVSQMRDEEEGRNQPRVSYGWASLICRSNGCWNDTGRTSRRIRLRRSLSMMKPFSEDVVLHQTVWIQKLQAESISTFKALSTFEAQLQWTQGTTWPTVCSLPHVSTRTYMILTRPCFPHVFT